VQRITQLDGALTSLFAGFSALAHELEFTPVCELDDEATIAAQKYPGLYRIDIRVQEHHKRLSDWASWFRNEWVKPEYERKHVPNPKKKRLAAHSVLTEWMPLYLGKSKHVAGRVWEHLYLSLEQPTTALKLKARTNLIDQRFRLSTIQVEVENYDLIMPQLESALRNKYNPILGRQ
jgi:hypothetical protein